VVHVNNKPQYLVFCSPSRHQLSKQRQLPVESANSLVERGFPVAQSAPNPVQQLDLGLHPAETTNLEQNQSEYALLESLRGGFFLRKKPLEGFASGYSNSGFAIAHEQAL
jgi:hypothetical protein